MNRNNFSTLELDKNNQKINVLVSKNIINSKINIENNAQYNMKELADILPSTIRR